MMMVELFKNRTEQFRNIELDSEMAYSELFRKQGSLKEYSQTAKLIKYGLGEEKAAVGIYLIRSSD